MNSYTHYVNTGHLQRGGGFGGMLKGWVSRAIPILKSKAILLAKSFGRDLAVQTLDSAYEVGRDILVNKKTPLNAVYDQGKKEFAHFKNKFTKPSAATESPYRAIKRKQKERSLILNRNVKRKRANRKPGISKVKGGFRKVIL